MKHCHSFSIVEAFACFEDCWQAVHDNSHGMCVLYHFEHFVVGAQGVFCVLGSLPKLDRFYWPAGNAQVHHSNHDHTASFAAFLAQSVLRT